MNTHKQQYPQQALNSAPVNPQADTETIHKPDSHEHNKKGAPAVKYKDVTSECLPFSAPVPVGEWVWCDGSFHWTAYNKKPNWFFRLVIRYWLGIKYIPRDKKAKS